MLTAKAFGNSIKLGEKMQKVRSTESGFGMIGIAIVVAAILLVGVIAIRAYQAVTNKPGASTQSAQSAHDTPIDASTYLDIKELGAKIKLNDDIKDAVYYYDSSLTEPVVRVSTQSLLDKSGGSCDPKTTDPFGSIRKTYSKTYPNGMPLKANGESVFQFDDYYIVYSTPNSVCDDNGVADGLQTTQLASFKEALKTLQLDK